MYESLKALFDTTEKRDRLISDLWAFVEDPSKDYVEIARMAKPLMEYVTRHPDDGVATEALQGMTDERQKQAGIKGDAASLGMAVVCMLRDVEALSGKEETGLYDTGEILSEKFSQHLFEEFYDRKSEDTLENSKNISRWVANCWFSDDDDVFTRAACQSFLRIFREKNAPAFSPSATFDVLRFVGAHSDEPHHKDEVSDIAIALLPKFVEGEELYKLEALKLAMKKDEKVRQAISKKIIGMNL